MQADKIRAEQIEAGRRQSKDESKTIRSPRPTKKAAPKGHEAFLKALEDSEATVEFEKISTGDLIQGVIRHSDKYTVSIQSGSQTRVLFKHDISEFRAVTPRATEAA